MSQDIISDMLNQIMNAKKARKESVIVKRHSKLAVAILEIAKKAGYIQNFEVKMNELKINFSLNKCGAIKPRFDIYFNESEKYAKRYLPSRELGILIVSTSRGVMTHLDAIEKKVGGCLIAYFY